MKRISTSFIFARDSRQLPSKVAVGLYYFWNSCALLLSSALLCAICLNFAIGDLPLFYVFLGYFKVPEIFLCNWLPILFLQIVLFALIGRQWIAFLMNSICTVLVSLGNYYKLKYRSDPFTFEDISSIRAGLTVAGDYDLSINWRIIAVIIFVILGCLILFFFAGGKPRKKTRLFLLLGIIASIWPLWKHVYSNPDLYYETYRKNYVWIAKDERDRFIATGFQYPFLHSISTSANTAPSGYDEARVERVLNEHVNMDIPDNEKVNILMIQLESFSNMTEAGIPGVLEKVYTQFNRLRKNSLSGTLIANVIGGGTISTERSVLTGN